MRSLDCTCPGRHLTELGFQGPQRKPGVLGNHVEETALSSVGQSQDQEEESCPLERLVAGGGRDHHVTWQDLELRGVRGSCAMPGAWSTPVPITLILSTESVTASKYQTLPVALNLRGDGLAPASVSIF